jgi:glycosyltransferase involved in cell wall biosynthesis
MSVSGNDEMKTNTTPRVIACCGGMVIVAGLERMTFEVLRTLRQRGAAVHCIVNNWENHRIVALADQIGASWSTGYYRFGFGRRLFNPIYLAKFLWDVAMTSLGLLRDARRFRPTHVLLPDFVTVLKNAPALVLLRCLGVKAVLRVGNHPSPGQFYRLVWAKVVASLVNLIVPNSFFSSGKLLEAGVPAAKTRVIRNAVSERHIAPETDAEIIQLVKSRRTILCVGQIAPFKGTHLAVEAGLKLLDEGENVQVVIVGRLPNWPPEFVEYVETMQLQIDRAGANERIQFVGECQNVPEIMRGSYLLMTPILQEETFGNIALEAKHVGLPVVTFPTGGLLELVDHQRTGYVCHDSTLESLVEGIRYFLHHPAVRDAASAACLEEVRQPDYAYSQAAFQTAWWEVFGLADGRAKSAGCHVESPEPKTPLSPERAQVNSRGRRPR